MRNVGSLSFYCRLYFGELMARRSSTIDVLSLCGIILGFAALLGGNLLEGGTWRSLINGPAALIVFGGTIGAAILQTPVNCLKRALKMLTWIFTPPKLSFIDSIHKIIRWAVAARKEGLLGLEAISETEKDNFSKKGLQLLIDGGDPDEIRRVMETDMIIEEQRDQDAVKFYFSMGGYAPTIGIIGAVMGLIYVMRNLDEPSQLGAGIAIAFVATIYGVAIANLLLLPIANKLMIYVGQKTLSKELIIEGIIAIAEGENPKAIELKLNGYIDNS